MLADDQIEIGVVGHAVAFVGGTTHFLDAALGVPTPPDVGGHVGEQKKMLDGVPDRPLGEREPRTELADRREGVDQGLEFRLENGMGHGKAPFEFKRHCERQQPSLRAIAKHQGRCR